MSFDEPPTAGALGRLLGVLRAAGEETRLRILLLLSRGELTVGEIADILGQSQPRVSRHLKLLVEAGLLERFKEGACSFHRLVDGGAGDLAAPGPETVVWAMRDFGLEADPVVRADMARLKALKADRARAAETYFAAKAGDWDELRAGGVSEESAAAAVARAFASDGRISRLIDLGAGAGGLLVKLADIYDGAVGLDLSQAMLRVARAKFEAAGLNRVQARHGDLMAPPFEPEGFDGVLIHQVLHYLEDPVGAFKAAARLLSAGGVLVAVDLAAHEEEELRLKHLHRRLGFSDEEITRLAERAGLRVDHAETLPGEGALAVRLWRARKEGAKSDDFREKAA